MKPGEVHLANFPQGGPACFKPGAAGPRNLELTLN